MDAACRSIRPAAFLDRDGVLNVDKRYVVRIDQFEWIPGAIDFVKLLNDSGYYVIVVTNQSGVARGMYSAADVEALHEWMQCQLHTEIAHIDAFYYCPHHPDFTGSCACRKPSPGMLIQATREWPVDLSNSFLIGDSQSDILAARAMNLRALFFPGGNLLDFGSTLIKSRC
jgi:D-glycero-D-manno-heptose 1,7-bisphosphate phosphatase